MGLEKHEEAHVDILVSKERLMTYILTGGIDTHWSMAGGRRFFWN